MLDFTPVSYLDRALAGRAGSQGSVIDVGAAHGDFTADLRAKFPLLQVVAVEPTPAAATSLRDRFATDPQVQVEEVALGAQTGEGTLHRYVDGTQNGLSPLLEATPSDLPSLPVRIQTLDALLDGLVHLPPTVLLKVDTQGNDLQVLLGAQTTLSKHRPLVQVEVIFASLYAYQNTPAAIFAFLSAAGYYLADVAMSHTDSNGRLAYADWIFTPKPPITASAPFLCRDPLLLAEQAVLFRQVAEERLQLIGTLDRECRARLTIIDDLTKSRDQHV